MADQAGKRWPSPEHDSIVRAQATLAVGDLVATRATCGPSRGEVPDDSWPEGDDGIEVTGAPVGAH